MADLHETHEEQVERTVSSPEAVTEYLNGYVRPYRIWYERTAKRNYRYLSWTRSIAITTGVLATVFAACPDAVAKSLSPFGTELTRYLAAIFSAFATVASGMLQYYFAQAARIREAGRVKCSYVEQLVYFPLERRSIFIRHGFEVEMAYTCQIHPEPSWAAEPQLWLCYRRSRG
jgi:hypothetical protein